MPEHIPTALPTCPMAETCRGMMGKSFSGIALLVSGLFLIALGVLIVVEPQILEWVIAVALVFLGVMIMLTACFIRKIGKQLRNLT